MEITIVLGVTLILLLIVSYLWKQKKSLQPPGPRPLPLIGNLWKILSMKYPAKEITELSRKYGPVMQLKLGPRTCVILSTKEAINNAFVTNSWATLGRPVTYGSETTFAPIDTGIILKDGDPWKFIRRFTLSTLRDFGYGRNIIQEKIIEESEFIKSVLENTTDNIHSNLRNLFMSATSNVTCSLVFGHRFEYKDEQFKKLLQIIESLTREVNFLNVTVFFDRLRLTAGQRQRVALADENKRVLDAFLSDKINEHKEDFDKNNIRDYVDAFLKNLENTDSDITFDETDMRVAIEDLLVAGTETTATTLTWAILYMIVLPEIQKRCQAEIDSIVEGNRPVYMQDKQHMPYTEATLLEVQRISSIVPLGIPHRATHEFKVHGYSIPKDTMLMSNIYGTHHDEKVFEMPEQFRPERFLGENNTLINTDNIVPFSIGPRTCLGEGLARSELFLFFANVLNTFSFTRIDGECVDVRPAPKNATIRVPLPFNFKATLRHI